jgi:hypothetical protein
MHSEMKQTEKRKNPLLAYRAEKMLAYGEEFADWSKIWSVF